MLIGVAGAYLQQRAKKSVFQNRQRSWNRTKGTKVAHYALVVPSRQGLCPGAFVFTPCSMALTPCSVAPTLEESGRRRSSKRMVTDSRTRPRRECGVIARFLAQRLAHCVGRPHGLSTASVHGMSGKEEEGIRHTGSACCIGRLCP